MSVTIVKSILFYIFFIIFVKRICCKTYNNYTLYRGTPVNQEHLDYFNNLTNIYDVNFWRHPSILYKPIDFVISPEDRKNFLEEIEKKEIYLTTIITDVQRAFDRQTVLAYVRRNLASFNWNNFYRLNDIYNWLRDLQKAHPNEMKVLTIGETEQKRKILAVTITLKGCENRSKVIVEGGIHAREWISPSVVTYMIREIVQSPQSSNVQLKKIARTYQWIFIPVVNPDGYEYSHTKDRLWRKNRSKPHGVDINRNFDIAFGTVGVEYNRYSEIYCGPTAFSEKESVAVSKFIKSHKIGLEYYIAFHSYGQYMILPYAHSKKHVSNYNQVYELGMKTAKSIYKRYSTKYVVGTAYDTVGYTTSGVSGCWVKNNFQVPYVLTFELRDEGQEGFALPPEEILPTCKETMDGMMTLLTPQTPLFKKSLKHPDVNRSGLNVYTNIPVTVCNIIFFIVIRYY